MDFKHFSVRIGLRILLLTAVLGALMYLFIVPGYPTVRILLAVFAVLQVVEVFRFVSRTNSELKRFLDAARYADFGQRFEIRH